MTWGCVQHNRIDGSLPYLVTIAPAYDTSNADDYVEFLFGDTAAPHPKAKLPPFNLVKQIAREFVETGIRSNIVAWEEV